VVGGHRGPRARDDRREQASRFSQLGRLKDRTGVRSHCTGQSSGTGSYRARPVRAKVQTQDGTVPLRGHSSTMLLGISSRTCSDARASLHRRLKRKRPRSRPRLQPIRGRAGARPRAATGGKARSSGDWRARLPLGSLSIVQCGALVRQANHNIWAWVTDCQEQRTLTRLVTLHQRQGSRPQSQERGWDMRGESSRMGKYRQERSACRAREMVESMEAARWQTSPVSELGVASRAASPYSSESILDICQSGGCGSST